MLVIFFVLLLVFGVMGAFMSSSRPLLIAIQPPHPAFSAPFYDACAISGGGLRCVSQMCGILSVFDVDNFFKRINVLSATSGGSWTVSLMSAASTRGIFYGNQREQAYIKNFVQPLISKWGASDGGPIISKLIESFRPLRGVGVASEKPWMDLIKQILPDSPPLASAPIKTVFQAALLTHSDLAFIGLEPNRYIANYRIHAEDHYQPVTLSSDDQPFIMDSTLEKLSFEYSATGLEPFQMKVGSLKREASMSGLKTSNLSMRMAGAISSAAAGVLSCPDCTRFSSLVKDLSRRYLDTAVPASLFDMRELNGLRLQGCQSDSDCSSGFFGCWCSSTEVCPDGAVRENDEFPNTTCRGCKCTNPSIPRGERVDGIVGSIPQNRDLFLYDPTYPDSSLNALRMAVAFRLVDGGYVDNTAIMAAIRTHQQEGRSRCSLLSFQSSQEDLAETPDGHQITPMSKPLFGFGTKSDPNVFQPSTGQVTLIAKRDVHRLYFLRYTALKTMESKAFGVKEGTTVDLDIVYMSSPNIHDLPIDSDSGTEEMINTFASYAAMAGTLRQVLKKT